MSTTLTERGRPAPTPRRRTRRRRTGRWIAAAVVVALLGTAAYAVAAYVTRTLAAPTDCIATIDTAKYTLGLDQASNATTIAAVGQRLNMPNHAVTIALAAALQESNLKNLSYGDRDSLGLFQQRPSQGWGTPAQLMTPSYAAAAFYNALGKIHGWETLAVTDAAQEVQRSASPLAYAKWETEARTLAIALTGERAAAFACKFHPPKRAGAPLAYQSALTAELGVSDVSQPSSDAQSWAIAAWLVGHAQQYHIASVATQDRIWTPGAPRWRSTSKAPGRAVVVTQQPAG
jgi:hypothetical protein